MSRRFDGRMYRHGEFGDAGMWLPLQCPMCGRVKWCGHDEIACVTGHPAERMDVVDGEPQDSPDIVIQFLS